MKKEELIKKWKDEEEIAYIHGWDFSHIEGRFTEETDFGWDYVQLVKKYLREEMQLLDIDTGGGEILLSLEHPHANTAASEGYPPNIELCKKELAPLGIDFRPGNADGMLPFEDERFDIIINRHGSFNPQDIYRMLKPGGLFVTQQVGADNDRELVNLLCGNIPVPFPEQHLKIAEEKFMNAGFTILESDESFKSMKFYDTGALVWFARIIQWEYPDFSVENNLDNLFNVQALIEQNGFVEGKTHRFMLVAKK